MDELYRTIKTHIKSETGMITLEASLISGISLIIIFVMSYVMILSIYSDGVESCSNLSDNAALYGNVSLNGIKGKADIGIYRSERECETIVERRHKTLGMPVKNEFTHWKKGPTLLKSQLVRDMITAAKGGKKGE